MAVRRTGTWSGWTGPGSVPAVCGLLLMVVLSGCGLSNVQKEGVRSFGEAAGAMGALTSENLRTFREDVIRMKTLRHAVEGTTLPAARPDGQAPDRAFYAEELNLDSGLDPDNLETRRNAADMLVAYGDLLRALSEKSREKEIADASERFMGSVRGFPGNPLSEEQVGGLGKLLAAAGGLWVEREKKMAVRTVVPAAAPLVEKLCDALETDFDITKRGIARDVDVVQDRLAIASIDGLKRPSAGAGDRVVLIEGFLLANDTKARVDHLSRGALKAIASLRKANRELGRLVADESFSLETITSYSNDVDALVAAVKPFMKRRGG